MLFMILSLGFALSKVTADTSFYKNDYPYNTFTVDYEGNLTPTQTAYVPVGILNRNVSFSNPQDLYIKNDLVYVADTGNSRIAVLDYAGNLVREIGVGDLGQPTGVFVSDTGFVYVADKQKKLVFKYTLDGTLVTQYGRPTEPLFGLDSPYTPIKVVVGSGENIYIIGDGSTSGVIQLNYDGSFLGYFGVNLSQKSVIQKIADIFVKPGQYASTAPPSPTNIAINSQSLVYTSTPNTETALKKLDVNGENILTATNYDPEHNVVDLSVNDLGYLYAIYDDGMTVEYDPDGNLLFAFNILASNSNILGLIQTPSGIQVDQYNNIFLLDQGKSEVIVYQPTAFTKLVHEAIDYYDSGDYTNSTLKFEDILKQNDNFALAHSALGKSFYQDMNYSQALTEYYKANNVDGYSNTYWKMRDIWLTDNLNFVFYIFLALMVISITVKQLNKRTKVFANINYRYAEFKKKPSVRRYTLIFSILRHPIDSYYEIKREKRANLKSASVMLFILFVEYLLYLHFTGYIFNHSTSAIHIGVEVAKFFGVVLLFIFSNYLIATLFNGEGWLKDVYIAIIYALAPFMVFLPFYVILSNFLTLNEAIILNLFSLFMFIYAFILVFLAVREIHNYEIGETFKNLLLTIFVMLIIVLIGFIIYVFGSQLYNFLVSLIKEVFFRVFG